MLKSKTLMNLLGIFVAAILGWTLLNMWYVPTVGKCSCGYTPWFLALARRTPMSLRMSLPNGGGDDCPSTLDEA